MKNQDRPLQGKTLTIPRTAAAAVEKLVRPVFHGRRPTVAPRSNPSAGLDTAIAVLDVVDDQGSSGAVSDSIQGMEIL